MFKPALGRRAARQLTDERADIDIYIRAMAEPGSTRVNKGGEEVPQSHLSGNVTASIKVAGATVSEVASFIEDALFNGATEDA